MTRQTTRADMHVHSRASTISKLGVQRSLAMPECATEPAEVYELAKRRGMDFVTITDHDTIDGALAICDLPDTFISEELTVAFRGERQAVHVLCYGITPADHEWLQTHNDDVDACAEYLRDRQITAALAHPFYAVRAPLTAGHRRRLAQLFPIWETRNGSRAKELNLPAFVYIETHGGNAIGGSDDHAGVDIGRTFTETPAAASAQEFLDHIRAGRAVARGDHGSAAKWTHAAIALAIRSLGGLASGAVDPGRTLKIAQRLLAEGDARHGAGAADLGPQDARALLAAWLQALGLDPAGTDLLALLSGGALTHADLYRSARAVHEQRLGDVVACLQQAAVASQEFDIRPAGGRVFDACVPAIPYAAATAFLAAEKRKLVPGDGESPRVALVADGLDAMHGVSSAVREIRQRGVREFEVEVIATDGGVDRRLSAVASLEVPYYAGLRIGVPTVTAIVEALTEGRYDLVHVCTPGPAGILAGLIAHLQGLPLVGSYHTELGAYVQLRSGRADLQLLVAAGLRALYGACELVLSPSAAADERLAQLGIAPGAVARWDRGVDLRRFDPALRTPNWLPGEVNVLYAGRLAREKGIDRLAEAFERAHATDPRLHLVLAGVGPEEHALRQRLGPRATFLGWLRGEALARTYASADAFLFASTTDTFGQVILEAQASGLPVIAVAAGGPASLIEHAKTGLLVAADTDALARALLAVTGTPALAQRVSRGGREAARKRSWEASLDRLGASYRQALAAAHGERAREIAS